MIRVEDSEIRVSRVSDGIPRMHGNGNMTRESGREIERASEHRNSIACEPAELGLLEGLGGEEHPAPDSAKHRSHEQHRASPCACGRDYAQLAMYDSQFLIHTRSFILQNTLLVKNADGSWKGIASTRCQAARSRHKRKYCRLEHLGIRWLVSECE